MAFALRASRRPAEGLRRLGTFVGVSLALLSMLGAARAEAAVDLVELPAGVVVEHDGAGGLRIVDGDDVLWSIDLLWVRPEQPSLRGTALSAAAGATVREREFDETFVSTAPELLPRGVTLAARLRHWPYYHVDDIAFVDAGLRRGDALLPGGTAALALRGVGTWEVRRLRQQPHLSVGRAPWVEFDLVQATLDRPDGGRLYLGLVRLDRRGARVLGEHEGLVWEPGALSTWPLALIAARTRSSLEFLAGQALLTYDRAGASTDLDPRWKVPPLCGRCRDPRVDEVRVELGVREGQLHLQTRVLAAEPVENLSAEGLRIEGIPLGRNLFRARGGEAEYGMLLSDPLAKRIVDAAERGGLDVELWTNADSGLRPDRLEVEIEPGTSEAILKARSARESIDDVLPSYLSPQLVSSWPNPFRGETTIEVTVPSTLGEAFELDATALARVSATDPVPFGTAPTVRVRVYNVGGQLVQTLTEEVRTAGRFSVQWNGSDVQGQPVAAGAYYVNVEMGDWSVTRRVLRLAP